MMTYYADESYDGVTFCVGGWLYDTDGWKKIERRWNRRIEYEQRRSIKRGETPISRFHAADCSNRRGEFYGWSVLRQTQFFKKLIGIVCDYQVVGIAWGTSFTDLKEHFPDYKQKKAQDVLYYLCMQQCLGDLAGIMYRSYPGERVTVFHDSGFNGTALAALEKYRRDRPDASRSILTIAPLEWKDSIALQPADLMAYEGAKACFRHRSNIQEMRRSLHKLLDSKDVSLSVGYLDESTFKSARETAEERGLLPHLARDF
ncbi:MAG TPA: hypothetical protein VN682_19000 [Terriglobales bacterium]|nr:hypothetical protein [Terriglobales bacterium]